jgi:presenilin-like A22 family membrane protease
LVNLSIKIKIPIFVYFLVCELNKIFRNLCICLLCTVCVFFVYCFEVQIVEMALGSAASSSDSLGVRRSQKVKNHWYMVHYCLVVSYGIVILGIQIPHIHGRIVDQH